MLQLKLKLSSPLNEIGDTPLIRGWYEWFGYRNWRYCLCSLYNTWSVQRQRQCHSQYTRPYSNRGTRFRRFGINGSRAYHLTKRAPVPRLTFFVFTGVWQQSPRYYPGKSSLSAFFFERLLNIFFLGRSSYRRSQLSFYVLKRDRRSSAPFFIGLPGGVE